MKFFKSRFFIVSVKIAVILVLVPSALSIFGYAGLVRSALKTVATPFEWVGTQIANAANGFVSVFTEYDELREENQRLREELAAAKDASYENEVLKAENDWLKEYLNLREQNADVTVTDATVIARESGNYATVLTINRGRVHGLLKRMPVLTEDGVFGYISECGLDWA